MDDREHVSRFVSSSVEKAREIFPPKRDSSIVNVRGFQGIFFRRSGESSSRCCPVRACGRVRLPSEIISSQLPAARKPKSVHRSKEIYIKVVVLCCVPPPPVCQKSDLSPSEIISSQLRKLGSNPSSVKEIYIKVSVIFFLSFSSCSNSDPKKPSNSLPSQNENKIPNSVLEKTAKFNPSQKQNPKRSRVKVLPRVCVKRCTAGVKVWEAARWLCLLPCFKAKQDQCCLPCSAAGRYWLRFRSQSALPPGEYQKISLCIRPTSAT